MQQLFFGIVESREDPLKIGRCQVRVFGVHTDDKELLPTEDLPYAVPLQSVSSAGISGIGISPIGLVEGSTVAIIFADGEDMQIPVILGSLFGIGTPLKNNQRGFTDKNGIFPKATFSGKSELPTLASRENESDDEEVQETVSSGLIDDWKSPLNSYDAQYPFNQATVTESGHIMEFDNTPDKERIRITHKNKSEIEFQPDGNYVNRVTKDRYSLIAGNDFLSIKGDCKVTVEGNIQILCNSNVELVTDGNLSMKVGGNFLSRIQGKAVIHSSDDLYLVSDGKAVLRGSTTHLNPISFGYPNDLAPELEITALDAQTQQDEPETDPGISDDKFNELKERSKVTDYKGESGAVDNTPPATEGRQEEIVTEGNLESTSEDTILAGNWKIRDLTTGAVFPHKLRGQVGLTEKQIADNLQHIATNILLPLERKYGRKNIQINSGFRRANDNSQHSKGEALDLVFRNAKSQDDYQEIAAWIRDNLAFDQLIVERGRNFWIHVSSTKRQSRKQVLTRIKSGRYVPGIVDII